MKKLYNLNFLLLITVAIFTFACQDAKEPTTDPDMTLKTNISIECTANNNDILMAIGVEKDVNDYYVGYATEEDFQNKYNSDLNSLASSFISEREPRTFNGSQTISLKKYYGELLTEISYIVFAVEKGRENATVFSQEATTLGFSLDISIGEWTAHKHTQAITYTPSDENSATKTKYIFGLLDNTHLEQEDGQIIEWYLDQLEAFNFLEYFICEGEHIAVFENLYSETEYMAIAFAYDDNTLLNPLFRTTFTTGGEPDPVPMEDHQGAIQLSATPGSVNISVTTDMGDFSGKYLIGVSDATAWNESLGDLYTLATDFWMTLTYEGVFNGEVDNMYVFDSNLTNESLMGWVVRPNTDQFVLVAALDQNGRIDETIEPSIVFVTTEEAQEDPNMTIDVEVENISVNEFDAGISNADIIITPSNEEALYYSALWISSPFEGKSDSEIFEALQSVESYSSNFRVGGATLSFTTLPLATDITVFSFGVDNQGNPITQLFRDSFTTAGSATTSAPHSTQLMLPYAQPLQVKSHRSTIPFSTLEHPRVTTN